MLPQDVGSMVPAMPTSNNGEHIMGLPLREGAGGIRARLSDCADQPILRQYFRARRNSSAWSVSALHRKLKALGVG